MKNKTSKTITLVAGIVLIPLALFGIRPAAKYGRYLKDVAKDAYEYGNTGGPVSWKNSWTIAENRFYKHYGH